MLLPLVIICIMSLWTFFTAMAFELRMQAMLNRFAGNIASYSELPSELLLREENGFLEALPTAVISGAVSETVIRPRVISELAKEGVDFSVVEGGERGLSFLGSRYDSVNDDVILICSYRVVFPYFSAFFSGLPITQKVCHHAWVGVTHRNRAEEDPVEYVYITRTGTVYHTTLACTHLNLSIREVSGALLELERNKNGGKYKPCEVCKTPGGLVYYITDYGTRYHSDRNCSGLTRDVMRVPKSEAGGRPPCSRCGR